MPTGKIHVAQKAEHLTEAWRPQVLARLNGQEVKIARFHGTFVWHVHEDADEMFLGVRGTFRVEFRDGDVELGPGDMIVVPAGVEHRTIADEPADVLIFEPAGTRNTGNVFDPDFTAPA